MIQNVWILELWRKIDTSVKFCHQALPGRCRRHGCRGHENRPARLAYSRVTEIKKGNCHFSILRWQNLWNDCDKFWHVSRSLDGYQLSRTGIDQSRGSQMAVLWKSACPIESLHRLYNVGYACTLACDSLFSSCICFTHLFLVMSCVILDSWRMEYIYIIMLIYVPGLALFLPTDLELFIKKSLLKMPCTVYTDNKR